jgi:hypothetical protein
MEMFLFFYADVALLAGAARLSNGERRGFNSRRRLLAEVPGSVSSFTAYRQWTASANQGHIA